MQFSVTFRHMEATDALKSYARERMQRIKKYFPDPISVHVVMSTERRYNHRVDVNLKLHNGFKIAGHETTENMYSSIDLVSAKIERQIRRYKDKLRSHKVRELTPIPVLLSVVAERPIDEAGTDAEKAATDEHHVIEREKFHADPMSVSEAIMQLNLVHGQFLIFRNDNTGDINIICPRDDGSYHLIETSASS